MNWVRTVQPTRTLCCLLLLIAATFASAQNKILRFHGYEGTLFLWSGNLSARAIASEGKWIEPTLEEAEARQWKDALSADGYDGDWSNLLSVAKELPAGKGDVPVSAQLLFKQVPEGARFMGVAPGKLSASGSVTLQGEALQSLGIGSVTSALGGARNVSAITQRLGLQQFTGVRLWPAMSQSVAEAPLAVLTPSREIIWIERLPADAFATIPAASGRIASKAKSLTQKVPEPTKENSEQTSLPLAAIAGGLVAGVFFTAAAFYKPIFSTIRRKKPAAATMATKSPTEVEYSRAAEKLQRTLTQGPQVEPLRWLRDRAPQQVAEIDRSSKIGQLFLSKLQISLSGEAEADQRGIEARIASLQKVEADYRQEWLNLALNTGIGKAHTTEEIAVAVVQEVEGLKKRVGDQDAFMRKIALATDPRSADQSRNSQEALQGAVDRLGKRFRDSEALAKSLEKHAAVVEALQPGAYLGQQIGQALHRVRPALADREVFAIVGYLLNYSLATLQSATLNGDGNLRAAMVHNLTTICVALAPFEDGFAQIGGLLKPMVPKAELQPSLEKHSDQADYLTLLQKALDLRNLRLSPFYIATDSHGRPYSVNTALA